MIKSHSASSGATRRRFILIAGAVLLLVILAVLFWGPGPAEEGQERAPQPVAVEVAEVQPMTLRETVRGIGTLRAPQEVELSPEIAGRVSAIHFEEGGVVEEGQVLLELEDNKLRSQLVAREAGVRSAQVRLNNAQRVFERQERLREQGVVAEEEFERVQAELDTAAADLERFRAELALTEEQLSDTIIRAPFSGAISEQLVDRGAFVSAGAALARLYQMDPLELSFSVPERFLGRIQRGQEVSVSLAAYPEQSFAGVVSFVSPAIDESTRTLAVKAEIPNPERQLGPGAFATAVVTVGEREDRPVVPEESLVGTRTGYMVFVVDEGLARSRAVQVGLRREGAVEVTDGLESGEQVVRSGHMRLEDGSPVNVVNETSLSKGGAQ